MGLFSRKKYPSNPAERPPKQAVEGSVEVAGLVRDLVDKGKLKEAWKVSEDALARDWRDHNGHFGKALVLSAMNRNVEAISEGKHALSIEQNLVHVHTLMGCTYNKMKRFDKARNHFKNALELKPNDVRTMIGMGDGLVMEGRDVEARSIFDEIYDIDPNNAQALHSSAINYYNLNDYSNALECIERLLALPPDYTSAETMRENAKAIKRKIARPR